MVGPDYVRPEMDIPLVFKEAAAKDAKEWKAATPMDDVPRGSWWTMYEDARLDELVAEVAISNQTVSAAKAQYRQALASLDASRSSFFPSANLGASGTKSQASSSNASFATSPIKNTVSAQLSASWEADVWGRIGRTVEAGEASAAASQSDLQAALLSAQATLVQSYIQLRVNESQRQLLDKTVAAYRRSLTIAENRYAAGVAGKVDVAQAQTQLKSTEAQAIDLGVQRAQLEHAIAALIGKAPGNFDLTVDPTLPALPAIPLAIPSALLERRPDIAGAERRMAAANAQIGVAQAAFFPSLTLSASGGYQNSSLSNLFSLPNRLWSIGPSLALSLFDAGLRRAQKEQAIAAYDKNVATYRQTVLSAFQEVEDNLAALRILADEKTVQQAAADAARESLQLTTNQYLAGTVSYLNVVTTQAAALSAERSLISLEGQRLLASANLLKALGGDWNTAP